MTTRPWLFCAVAFLLALGARAASPQQDARRGQQASSFRSGVTAVSIDVRVVGRDGQPITDLKKEDFTILEDGVRQTIARAAPARRPERNEQTMKWSRSILGTTVFAMAVACAMQAMARGEQEEQDQILTMSQVPPKVQQAIKR
jgi:hypothetical protein